jgi:hypothetical protein
LAHREGIREEHRCRQISAARGPNSFLTSQYLISDAVRSAAKGISKEQWIAEVLSGHKGGDAAQLACQRQIVTLWSDGPWAWPRTSAHL